MAMNPTTYSQYNTYTGVVVLGLSVFLAWAIYQVLANRFLDRRKDEGSYRERVPSWTRLVSLLKRPFTFSAPSDLGATKVCPDCAETVRGAALICRFCRFRFASPEAAEGLSHQVVTAASSRAPVSPPAPGSPPASSPRLRPTPSVTPSKGPQPFTVAAALEDAAMAVPERPGRRLSPAGAGPRRLPWFTPSWESNRRPRTRQ